MNTRQFIMALCTYPFIKIYDLIVEFRDWIDIHVRHSYPGIRLDQPGTAASRPAAGGANGRLAIFSIFPSAASMPFLLNALRALRELAFDAVLVSTRPLAPEWRETLLPLCVRLIERDNVGRDFGSYKAGLMVMGGPDISLPEHYDLLLLLNDSMFFPHESAGIFNEALSQNGDWLAMFESQQMIYHAQSFFLGFRRAVFDGEAFRGYWKAYRPYNARRVVIRDGELGLTKALRATGRMPACLVSGLFVARKLDAFLATAALTDLLPLLGPIQSHYAAATFFSLDQDPVARAAALRVWLGSLPEKSNPTHVTGLLLNVLGGLPIKRDICYRGYMTMNQLAANAAGFTAEEREAMLLDLRARGLPETLTQIQRWLHRFGRI